MGIRRTLFVGLLLGALAAFGALLTPWLRAQSLTIGGYQLVSERRITRTVSEFTFRAALTNPGPALIGATARVTSLVPETTIVEADLTFGPIPASGAVTSQDTFTLRHDRTVPYSASNLAWTISPVVANRPPTAAVVPPGPIFVAQLVPLDGRPSSDPDGQSLTYQWTFLDRPAGSAATINSASASQASFLPDRPGQYRIRLRVSDGQAIDDEDIALTTTNSAPRADAGPDQTVVRTTLVTLDGSGSFDVDGDSLTYAWSFMSLPAGSGAALSDATAVRPTFTVDRVGAFVLRLVVNDGQVSSTQDVVVVNTANSPPTANAGADRTAAHGASVQLDGTGSADVDGDPLTYLWAFVSIPAGSTAVLANASGPQATFVADVRGDFVVRLTVNDGQTSAQDTVTITTENTRPVANAGADRTVALSSTVTLDGSGSTDVDGDSLTYQWALVSVPAGSTAILSNPSTVGPTFVVDVAGEYVAQLVVNDGFAASDADTVTISTLNTRPVADAGPNQSVLAGTPVLLDGTRSQDPDGDALTYLWSFTSIPAGSAAVLSGATSATPSFTVDLPGAYLVQLVVGDGRLFSDPDSVIVTTAMNTPPAADAGPDQLNVQAGALVTLDGSGSTDPDGHALTYQWSLLSVPPGSAAALSDTTAVQPTFVADQAGTYVAQLVVSDGTVLSLPDTVQVQVRGANRPPVADAGFDRNVAVGAGVTLDGGRSSDPDGDLLTHAWALTSIPAGSLAQLTNATTASPSLTPDVPGDYIITLTVHDGTVASSPDSVVVSASQAQTAPTVTGFEPTSGKAGDVITVTGTNFVGVQSVAFSGTPTSSVNVIGPTSLTASVPAAATTGPISVTTNAGTGASSGQFVVLPSEDFQLSVSPAIVTVPAGGSGAFQITLTGTGGFTNLATLSVSGAPPGASVAFDAATLTGGQSTQLTVGAIGVGAGSSSLTITASGLVDGVETTRTAVVTFQVLASGVTAISGRFLTIDDLPIPNVLVQMGNVQAHSDAAGNFLLQNVLAGFAPLMIDANVAVQGYPIYKVDLTVVAGQTMALPTFRITPPPPPERYVPIDNTAQAQIVTDPRYPGFELTLPRGATITGWDGVVKSKIAIERVLPSQLPVPPPPGPTQSLYQIHFGTPMGGVPTARLPVTLPNDQGLQPGQQGEIWWYDAAPFGGPGAWKLAGMGTVSQDGKKVVSNPGVGIDRFCGVCGLVCFINRILGQDNRNPDSPEDGDPVDLALGQMIESKTDLVLPGRIHAAIRRTYNPVDPFGGIAGFQLGLGPGWAMSVDVVLFEVNPSLRRLVLPGNARHDFVVQPNGTFVETTHRRFMGAVMTSVGNGIHVLRFKNGTTWRFARSSIAGVDLLTEESDPNGNTLQIERTATDDITRIVEPSGRALTLTHAGGRITQVTDPLGRAVKYSYNNGRLETVTDPAGGTTKYTYNAAGGILTVTDARGIEFIRNEYSPLSGRILRQIEADGGVWLFKYLVLPRVVAAVPQALNPAAVEESSASIAAGLTGDLRNAPISTTVVDPRGHSSTHALFGGFGTAFTDGVGQKTKLERDLRGQVLSAKDPLGRSTRLTYDDRGNVTTVTDPQNNVSTFEYEPTFNRLTRMTNALGHVTTFEYDAKGNLLAVTDPEQNAKPEGQRLKTRFTYSAFGQVLSTTDALGNVTTMSYDQQGDLTSVVDPLGNTSTLAYDVVSRVVAQTDPRSRTTTFGYDVLNQITDITDALGGRTQLSYDPNGNLLSVTDAKNNAVQYQYDLMDRVTRRTDPLGREEAFSYDANGNLTGALDRKGQTSTFTYDSLDRRTESRFADGSRVHYTFDAVGRLVSADDSADPHRPITFDYDSLDRLETETTALSTVHYRHDALGRRTQMLVSGSAPVSYSYDRLSRLRSVTQFPLTPATLEYDANSRRTLTTLPNGVSTEYRYDIGSRLTALLYRNAAGNLGDLTYQYDSSGNRTAVGGSLASAVLPAPVAQATHDKANQLLEFGNRQLTYDANGNLESVAEANNFTQFAWDARNRLVGMSGPGLAGSFSYDALGRRAVRNVNGRRTLFAYDGVDTVSELIDGVASSYLRTLGIDEVLVRNGTEHYIADALGSTVALTDPAGGIATRYTYEPFGATTVAGSPSENTVQFTGRENDSTGLYFYRARYYSPTLHRFIAEDPIGLSSGDPNAYSYVGNRPSNVTDPSGQCGADLLLDAAFIAYDIFRLATSGRKERDELWGDLALDVVGAAIPCATGLGAARRIARAANAADSAKDAVQAGRRVTTDIVATRDGLVNVRTTIDRIKSGERFPHRNDGSVFKNREGLLPNQPSGYYREYVHPTPGVSGPGAQRIIQGQRGELYYSPDHYRTFVPLN